MGGRKNALQKASRVGAYPIESISYIWSKALRSAKKEDVSIPEKFVARKLRSSFVTALRKTGADFEELQTYIGHAPSSILSAHYDRMDLERLSRIARLSQELYEGIRAFEKKQSESLKIHTFGQ